MHCSLLSIFAYYELELELLSFSKVWKYNKLSLRNIFHIFWSNMIALHLNQLKFKIDALTLRREVGYIISSE